MTCAGDCVETLNFVLTRILLSHLLDALASRVQNVCLHVLVLLFALPPTTRDPSLKPWPTSALSRLSLGMLMVSLREEEGSLNRSIFSSTKLISLLSLRPTPLLVRINSPLRTIFSLPGVTRVFGTVSVAKERVWP